MLENLTQYTHQENDNIVVSWMEKTFVLQPILKSQMYSTVLETRREN